jgi:hypothetical protein
MNESYVDPTSKYYIDRLWEEYHKMKEELADKKCKLGQSEDYISETLKPELEDLKKSATIAWDELDKSHTARAKLHDELIIAEGQRDQWKMKYEAAVEYNLQLRAYNESLVPLIEAAQELENSYHDIYVVNKVRQASKNIIETWEDTRARCS